MSLCLCGSCIAAVIVLNGSLSGSSRGFLLVRKNYPISELKDFFVAL